MGDFTHLYRLANRSFVSLDSAFICLMLKKSPALVVQDFCPIVAELEQNLWRGEDVRKKIVANNFNL